MNGIRGPNASAAHGVFRHLRPVVLLACLPIAVPALGAAPTTAPANLRAVVGNGELTFHWDAVADATGYRYRLKEDAAAWSAWTDVAGGATSHTAYHLTNGTTYQFKVRATNGNRKGPASAAITATPASGKGDEEEAPPPEAPANLRVSEVGDGRLTFAWDAVAEATGYRYRLQAGSDAWGEWTDVAGGGTSHTAENLANGTAYSFKVRAAYGARTGPASAEISATPAAARNLAQIPDAALRHCVEWALEKDAGADITEVEMASLTHINCRAYRLDDGSLDPRTSPHGTVSSLAGLEFATSLSSLALRGNAVSDLSPLAGLVSLTELRLRDNAVSDLSPLARLPLLTELGLSENKVSDLSPLGRLTSLTALELSANDISDLSPLAQLRSLTFLSVANNPVSNLAPLAHLESLANLSLTRSGVSDLSPLAGLTSLTELELSANAISDVSPLADLTSLFRLGLGVNAVADISALSKLVSLTYLGLYDNNIADISALRGLEALEELYLNNNRVSDLTPLTANAGLGNGDYVELLGNPIACGSQADQVRVLRERGTRVYADAAVLAAPRAFAATPGDESAQLHWQAPADCHVTRYEVRRGVGKSPDFGPWREITGTWREVVDTGRMRHTVSQLANGLLHTFEIRAVGADGAAGQAARVHAFLAESPEALVAIEDAQLSAGLARALGKTAPAGKAAPGQTASATTANRVTITQGEMATLTALDLRTANVADLAGLQYASNLKSLLLRGNRVSDLAPITGLEFLTSLDLGANDLSDISALAHMPALERLWLNDNVIVDISPLVANTGLGEGEVRADGSSDYVDLRGNPLSGDSVVEHAPLLRERGAAVLLDGGTHLLPVFVPSGDHPRQGFARIINLSAQEGEVSVTAIDASGRRVGPRTLPIGARSAMHFNSDDLEHGNAEKGLSPGFGAGVGDWRLELRSALPLEVFGYMRGPNGVVTSMTALAPEEHAQHRIGMFNPGSNGDQTSSLRVINPAGKAARVLLEGVDDQGNSASVALTVPAGGHRDFTAALLEEGGGLGVADGAFGDGAGKWRITATSYDGVQVVNMLTNPAGHRANLSAAPSGDGGAVQHLPLLPRAASFPGRTGFVRVVNHSPSAGGVEVRAIDADGRSQVAGTLTLRAGGAMHFNAHELEGGNAAKGLTGLAEAGVASEFGGWRLELRSNLAIAVYGFSRAPDGFLASIHEQAPVTATGAHRVAYFNPASNSRQASRLRLVNTGATAASVRISGVDDAGNPAATAVRLNVAARGARELTAHDLEMGGPAGVEGAFGDGVGKWRLVVESDNVITVMSLVEDRFGHLTNLSR